MRQAGRSAAPRIHFERYELKYWVPEAAAQAIVRRARAFVRADAFAAGQPGNRQWVTSLYLDTPDLEFVREHRDSDPDRFKLRVRAYGDPLRGPAFFEYKRKVKNVIVKRRATVPRRSVRALLDGSWTVLPRMPDRQRANLEAFLYHSAVRRAEPTVVVRYSREAYQSPEMDVRLTVDREISYQPARGADLTTDPRAWIPVDTSREHGEDGPRVEIELKFSGTAPAWLAELTERLELFREAYSKYVVAAEHEYDVRHSGEAWWQRPVSPPSAGGV